MSRWSLSSWSKFAKLFSGIPSSSHVMAAPGILQKLEARAVQAEDLIKVLQTELLELQTLAADFKNTSAARNQTNLLKIKEDNAKLKEEVNFWKLRLQEAEQLNNKPILGPVLGCAAGAEGAPPPSNEVQTKAPTDVSQHKSKKDKPAAKEKEAKGAAATKEQGSQGADDLPVDVGRLDLRVGRIVSVKKHPDADSLYVEDVDVGEAKPRTVVSGLVKYVSLEEMQDRMVVLLCNLKPAKMRGVTSEAMVMCASSPDKVEILCPPAGASPGDLVHVEGYPRLPDPVLNPKKKIFETVAPDLKTNDIKVATYKGVPFLVPGKGVVTAPSLTGVNIK